jgi:hypothetical protein
MKSLIRNTVLFLALSIAFGIAIAQQPESAPAAPATQTQAEPQKPEGAAQPTSEATQPQKPAAEVKSEKHEGLAKEEEEEEENAQLKY